MEVRSEKIIINGATSQYARWLRALDAEYAKVDGWSFSELLNFAVEFGRLINFYNLSDQSDGDWVNFFVTDPTMILASIEATDLAQIQAEFKRLEQLTLDARDFDRKFQLLRETFEMILDLARQVNRWLWSLDLCQESEIARLAREEIATAIETDLNGQLRQLKAYDEGAGLNDALQRPIGLDYSGFLPIWNLNNVCPDGSIYKGRTKNRKIDHAVPYLDPILYAFLDVISGLQSFASANLAATLEEGNHKPQIALYIAFCKLFQTAQDTINTLSNRYASFYYRDILREVERGPIPDSVYLTFALSDSEEVLSTTVPRGTLFPAGQDADGRDILYASDKDLVVTAARIAELLTLRVISGPLFTEPLSPPIEKSSVELPGSQVVRRILGSHIAVPEEEAEAAGTVTASEQTAWATFGSSRVGTTQVEVTEPATLGFAIASSYFWLTGGGRNVALRVDYSAEFKEKVLDPLLEKLYIATGLEGEAILGSVLEDSFTIYLSTSGGWFQVEKYEVVVPVPDSLPVAPPYFLLQFNLPPSVPPIVPFDPEAREESGTAPVSADPSVTDTNPAPGLPTLKAYLRQQPVSVSGEAGTVDVYPVSLIGTMNVTGFQINTCVANLASLQIENTDGEVDTTTPFLVFGGLPVVGSYLQIRHNELFVKTLDALSISLTWFNLPPNDDGFKGYYKYYVIGLDGHEQPDLFNNQVFIGTITVQNPGTWFLDDVTIESFESPPQQGNVYLFRTQEDCESPLPARDGKLCTVTGFNTLAVHPAPPPPYYDPSSSAIRLELTEPPYAFGYDLYAKNVLNAVIEDLPDPERCQAECATECQVLQDASLCIEQCLRCLYECMDECLQSTGAISPPEGDPCAQCLDECLECLIEVAIVCVEQCLARSKRLPCEEALRYINSCLTTATKLPDGERLLWVRQGMDECWQLLNSSSPPCVDPCIEKCLKILEAMICVWTCEVECGGKADATGECLTNCLTQCKARLDMAYSECFERCLDECLNPKKELKYPNEPYLPQAVSVTVNYSAHCTIGESVDDSSGQFFHLLPFGGYRQIDLSPGGEDTLLPCLSHPGNLYVGFSGLAPPQTLTLLFQMAVDSGDLSVTLPPVEWEYLSGNQWTCLNDSQVRADSTNGLQNTGIATLSLPVYEPVDNTVLSSDRQWLRAVVANDPGDFPKTIAIYPHALVAIWQDNENTGEHLRQPLPAHTINSSAQDLPDIQTIDQPIESFGGRPPETRRTFEVRVGERLQHKDRGVLGWDYERLVLERFPTIWKVRALPARTVVQGNEPGNVLVVVVPGPDSVEVVDPTVPRATTQVLDQIQTYLKGLISPFVYLHVVNPIYVRVEVITKVVFSDQQDTGACIGRLNDELVEYLSPWFYDAARAARGASYALEADISEFIQMRPYVETMVSLSLKHDPNPESLEWYFLTSAKEHDVSVVDDGGCKAQAGY